MKVIPKKNKILKSKFESQITEIINNNIKIVMIISLFILGYFIFSDIYLRESLLSFYARLLPISLAAITLLFHIISSKRKYLIAKLNNVFLATVPVMMYTILFIYKGTDTFNETITATIITIFIISLIIQTKTINTVIIYFLPFILFLLSFIFFLELSKKEILETINIIPMLIVGFAGNRIHYRLRYKAFKAKHLLINEKKKTQQLYEETLSQNDQLNQRNIEINEQKNEIDVNRIVLQKQKDEIEESHIHITDSINYAKNIQECLLPEKTEIDKYLPRNFIFYKPKDIVSGDFYWFAHRNNLTYIAAVDCTGHGVPGAFMSIIGNNSLNKALFEKNITEPNKILNFLNEEINVSFKRSENNDSVSDGMDLVLCVIDLENNILQFSGAKNPLVLVRNKEIFRYRTDNHIIGDFFTDTFKTYNVQEIELQKNDCIYIYSDGFADQYGGVKDRKFMAKKFRETLLDINHLSIEDQKQKLEEIFYLWKGNLIQTDDVLVIGIKI